MANLRAFVCSLLLVPAFCLLTSPLRNDVLKSTIALDSPEQAAAATSKRSTEAQHFHVGEMDSVPFSALFELGVTDASEAVSSASHAHTDFSLDFKGDNVSGVCGYAFALAIMVLVVTAMFHHSGSVVVGQIVTYVCCLAFIKISMKSIFAFGFNYAKFVTSLHLLASSLAAFLVLLHRYSTTGKPIVVPTLAEMFGGILPIALTFGLSIVSENSALVFVSAAFSEVVASSNPVMSAFLTWLCGMPFHIQLLAPIGVVVLGCVISIQGEVYFSSIGLALLLLSVFFRGLKAVMQQKLMTGETKDRFDPVTLMAWSCLFSFMEVFIYSLGSEGMAPFTTLAAANQSGRLIGLVFSIAVSCVIAVTLNITALFVIRQLGAVGMQMVSQMKALLVVIGGVVLLSESFTPMQQAGFLTVLAGVWWYSSMKRQLEPDAKGH